MADELRCEICRNSYRRVNKPGLKIKQCPVCDILIVDMSAFPGYVAKKILGDVATEIEMRAAKFERELKSQGRKAAGA